MVFNDVLMVTHFEMEGPLRYRQLRNYANRRNIHVRQIRHLRDRLDPLEEYDDEDFRLRFCLTKDSVSDLVKVLDKDLQHQTRRGLPLTPMQQVLIALRFYAQELSRGLLAIYLVFLYLLHAQSFTRFQGLLRNKT